MSNIEWSDEENNLIVADYFTMLTDELIGREYNKAEHRRALLKMLVKRSAASIEFKHRNISAVMDLLGQQKINGYKSLYSYQASLVNAVIRWLEANLDWAVTKHRDAAQKGYSGFSEESGSILQIDPAPTLSNAVPLADPTFAAAVGRKYDVAQRDARNRALGKAGEERVIWHERAFLRSVNRSDLADRVRWSSVEDGDGVGYDIFSFEPDGHERLIEVKTTNGWERTPFHITRNELDVADANRDTWHLVRLWNFAREPRAFSIRPPLDAHINLAPTSFLASLQ